MVSKNAILAAFSSTALISLAPNVLLLLFPRFASGGAGRDRPILSLGQALAAGGLLGDVFLHVVPHSGGSHDVGLWILLGFSIFLLTDMVIRSMGDGHDHGHSHGKKDDDKKCEEKEGGQLKVSSVLLNLTADALHNVSEDSSFQRLSFDTRHNNHTDPLLLQFLLFQQFTDGVAIGASFSNLSASHATGVLDLMKTRGGLATLSILFHEIPHELGDFAVLVKNGFSKSEAIMAQFGTAFAAMIGTSVGLLAVDLVGEALIWITSGGFVYLATVQILPELLDERASLRFRLIQLLFFCFGVAFLYAVCLLEEMDEFGDHGHSHGHGHKEEVHVEEAHAHHEEVRHDHHAHHSHHDHGHGHGHHEL